MNHHVAHYNEKHVEMGYVSNPKDEFKWACMRVSDNLPAGGVGYVETPKGEWFKITSSSRKAVMVAKPEDFDVV